MGCVSRDATETEALRVRTANQTDAPEMLRVERAAHSILADHGVDLETLRVPEGFEEPTQWVLAFVAEVDDQLVGMSRLSELDPGLLALDQVSVDPAYSGRGVGRRLLVEVAVRARELGYRALTGTTFRDLVFNAPFYRTLGCVEDLDPHPAMRRRREAEQELGLDQFGARLVMRLTL
jgi:predicted N-acetyltransferase YhbS